MGKPCHLLFPRPGGEREKKAHKRINFKPSLWAYLPEANSSSKKTCI
jgi:hypothetical protein